ncbi:MAG: hypothetical protein SNJ59_09180 [Aggregatilineales bacterium]
METDTSQHGSNLENSRANSPALFSNAERAALRAGLSIGLIALVLSLLIVFNDLRQTNFDPIGFANIGTRFSLRDPEGTTGYDGQFAYFIARYGANAEPFMDGPSLRFQRILYPTVARALAFGSPSWIPWTLIAINVLAHSLGAGLIAYLLRKDGGLPWIALAYGLWMGQLLAVRLDLHEPLCMALGLAATAAYRAERLRLATMLLVLATFTKELGLIFAGGLALHAALTGRIRWAVLLAGASGFGFLIWWSIMRLWFGTLPTIYPAAKLHWIPLQGMFAELEESLLEFAMLVVWLGLPAVIVFALSAMNLLRGLRLRQPPHYSAPLAVAGAGFVVLMPDVSWVDPVAAYRVAVPLVATGLLFLGLHYRRGANWMATLWGAPFLLCSSSRPSGRLVYEGACAESTASL